LVDIDVEPFAESFPGNGSFFIGLPTTSNNAFQNVYTQDRKALNYSAYLSVFLNMRFAFLVAARVLWLRGNSVTSYESLLVKYEI